MQHHAINPIPIQTIITSSMTPRNTGGMCADTSIPPRLESKHNPQYPMTLHLQHFGSYCCFFLSCLFEETVLNIPDREAKRIENHVLTTLRLGKSNVM